MSAPLKILFLAIDAGDKFLLRKWAMDGTLPTMHRLLSKGLVGDTVSVEGLYEGATWPSFYTGVNPARHGFHRLTQIQPGTYDFHQCRPGEFVRQDSFWKLLSDAGKKVTVLDVPLAGITRGLNGIQMVEWGSHDEVYGFHTWPVPLEKEVKRRFGNHPLKKACDTYGRSPGEFCGFRDRLIEGVEKKCELTLHYLKKSEWDFFCQVFTEGHCAGHQCWHLHDPAHPNYDPRTVSLTGDPIREVYRAIDAAMGRVLAHVDEKTLVFFLATHRMAPTIGGNFLLEEILQRLSLLKKPSAGAGSGQQGVMRQTVHFAKKKWGKLPESVKNALMPVLAPLYNSARRLVLGKNRHRIAFRMDLKNSRCFPHQNGNLASGIRINLAGREPDGLIKPGKEQDDFCRDLIQNLLEVVDGASGEPMIKRVMKTAEVYQGENIDHLPDLLVEWNDEKTVGSKALRDDESCKLQLTSEKIGTVEGEYTYCRSGDHRPEGLFAVFGPGIQPGVVERTVSIMDFAPTILNLFGITNPGMDGTPISEVLTKLGSL